VADELVQNFCVVFEFRGGKNCFPSRFYSFSPRKRNFMVKLTKTSTTRAAASLSSLVWIEIEYFIKGKEKIEANTKF
jgi:hypothetical protein